MNARAKISSKGQLVLPKAVREAYGLGPGSEVDIESAGFLKYDGPPVTVEDMERGVLEEARRRRALSDFVVRRP
jgi:AbrB family looped-hinge helix DNA binding protein